MTSSIRILARVADGGGNMHIYSLDSPVTKRVDGKSIFARLFQLRTEDCMTRGSQNVTRKRGRQQHRTAINQHLVTEWEAYLAVRKLRSVCWASQMLAVALVTSRD